MKIVPAASGDAREIQRLVNHYASEGKMLPLSLSEVYEKIRDFLVFRDKSGGIAGVIALHPVWEDLAEIRSLAVDPDHPGRGIGKQLVTSALEEAARLGFVKVFALTIVPGFFTRHGFREVAKSDLPQKIWRDCLKCVNFPDCNEVAMMIEVGEKTDDR